MFPAPTGASWAESHAGSFRRHGGVIAAPQFVSSFGLKFAPRLNSLHGKATRGSLAVELGYWPWEQNIRSVTSKATLVNSEPADHARLALEENALEGNGPSLWGYEHTEDVHSLLEENARLRGLLVQVSDLIRRNVVHAR